MKRVARAVDSPLAASETAVACGARNARPRSLHFDLTVHPTVDCAVVWIVGRCRECARGGALLRGGNIASSDGAGVVERHVVSYAGEVPRHLAVRRDGDAGRV